jgi:hypothetical protein
MHSLTKSSKPRSVPVNSRSLFMITHIRDPIHLSISSVVPKASERTKDDLWAEDNRPKGSIWDAIVRVLNAQESVCGWSTSQESSCARVRTWDFCLPPNDYLYWSSIFSYKGCVIIFETLVWCMRHIAWNESASVRRCAIQMGQLIWVW